MIGGEHRSCCLTGARISTGPVRLLLLVPSRVERRAEAVGAMLGAPMLRRSAGLVTHGGFVLLTLPLAGVYNGFHVQVAEDAHARVLSERLGVSAQRLAYLATGHTPPDAERALARLVDHVSRYDRDLRWEGTPSFALSTEAAWQRFAVAATGDKALRAARALHKSYLHWRCEDRARRARVDADRQASFRVVADSTPRDVTSRRTDEFLASVRIGMPVVPLAGEAVEGGITQTHCDGLVHVEVRAEGPAMPATTFALAPCPTRGGDAYACSGVLGADPVRWTPAIYEALADHRVSRCRSLARFTHTLHRPYVSPELVRLYRGDLTGRFARHAAETDAFMEALTASNRVLAPSPTYADAGDLAALDTQIAVARVALSELQRERAAWRRR